MLPDSIIAEIAQSDKNMQGFLASYTKAVMGMNINERKEWIKKHATISRSET